MWRDSCCVYAFDGPEGTVVVDAGTGAWLASPEPFGKPIVAVLCTHFFRDHAAGAAAAGHAGIPVWVPDHERELFEDPFLHFERRESFVIYDNAWQHFAPVEPIPVARALRDHETVTVGGLRVEVIPLPGASVGQTGYLVTLPNGRPVACIGETMHSAGRVPRLAPLQWGYASMRGAVAVYASARELRKRAPTALLPSLGDPVIRGVDDALTAVQGTMRRLAQDRRTEREGSAELIDLWDDPELATVTPRVRHSQRALANSAFVLGDSGRVLALDYGYNAAWGVAEGETAASPRSRRALPHSLDGLRDAFGAERIDVVVPSHYHDDHVAGIGLLQRLHGTECWAAEPFADVLARPEAYAFPCTWPEPVRVDRVLALGEPFEFDGIRFQLGPRFSGHTRFAALIGFDVDGKRFAHTGDQYFFQEWARSERRLPWGEDRVSHNYVYRNGASLDGYRRSAAWLLDWRPDIVLSGHEPPMLTDADFFATIAAATESYEREHELAMPLDDLHAHYGLDGMPGWIVPYRTHLPEPGVLTASVTVRNPLPRPAELELSLVSADERGPMRRVRCDGRREVTCELELRIRRVGRRVPFALEIVADGRPFGQVAEALVTTGGARF